MKSSEQHISYPTKARYYTLGQASTDKTLLIVLHGYGYLAKYFIKKFKETFKEEKFITIFYETF